MEQAMRCKNWKNYSNPSNLRRSTMSWQLFNTPRKISKDEDLIRDDPLKSKTEIGHEKNEELEKNEAHTTSSKKKQRTRS